MEEMSQESGLCCCNNSVMADVNTAHYRKQEGSGSASCLPVVLTHKKLVCGVQNQNYQVWILNLCVEDISEMMDLVNISGLASSTSVLPLVMSSAGFCAEGIYLQEERSVSSRISVTRLAMKIL